MTCDYKYLSERFIHIIKPYKSQRNPMAMFGFECDIGWYDIIHKLLLDIEKEMHNWTHDEITNFHVTQVKEKFGGLRFYVAGVPVSGQATVYHLIGEAESKSYHICEICSKPGKIRKTAWLQTLCHEHWLKSATKQIVPQVLGKVESYQYTSLFGQDKGKTVTRYRVPSDAYEDLEHQVAKIINNYAPDMEAFMFSVGQIVRCNMDQAKKDFSSFEGTTVHTKLLQDAASFRFKVTEITLNGYKMVRVHDNHPMPDITNVDAHKLFVPEEDPNGNENNVE